MDKKYYSSKHSRLNKGYKNKAKNKKAKGSFLLRINLCLGMAILVIGAYEIHSKESLQVTNFVRNSLNSKVNLSDITNKLDNIKLFVYGKNDIKKIVFNGDDVILDNNLIDEINNNRDLYYINNSKATEP